MSCEPRSAAFSSLRAGTLTRLHAPDWPPVNDVNPKLSSFGWEDGPFRLANARFGRGGSGPFISYIFDRLREGLIWRHLAGWLVDVCSRPCTILGSSFSMHIRCEWRWPIAAAEYPRGRFRVYYNPAIPAVWPKSMLEKKQGFNIRFFAMDRGIFWDIQGKTTEALSRQRFFGR